MDIKKKRMVSLAFLSLFFVSFLFAVTPRAIGEGSVPGLITDQPAVFLPGQGIQTLTYMGGCEGCPPPDALYPQITLSQYESVKNAVATLYVEDEEGNRTAVEDATVFAKVIYGGGSHQYCKMTTDEEGEATLNYGNESFALCDEQGCTLRFTFCCSNISGGECLVPLCLGDNTITSCDIIPPCPAYEQYEAEWPEEVQIDGEFVYLYPAIDEIYIPPPSPDFVAGFSFSFCLPILIIFGLLAAGMFASGRNPFAAFSFYTPRFKRGSEKMIRARGRSWNIQGIINKVSMAVSGASNVAKSAKSEGLGGALKKDVKGTLGSTPLRGRQIKGAVGGLKKKKGTGAGAKEKGAKEGPVMAGAGAPGAAAGGQLRGGRTQTGGVASAFRGAVDAKATMGAKIGVSMLGAFTIISIGFLEKMSLSLMPVYQIVSSDTIGMGALGKLMAKAVKTAGAKTTLAYCNAQEAKLGYSDNADSRQAGQPIVMTFIDENGEQQTMKFEPTEEGMKDFMEKKMDLLGDVVIAKSAASITCLEKSRMEGEANANNITADQLKQASEGKGLFAPDFEAAIAKYDKDGDGKLSKTEIDAAVAQQKNVDNAVAMLGYGMGDENGQLSADVLGGALAGLDSNGDGKFSSEELLAAKAMDVTEQRALTLMKYGGEDMQLSAKEFNEALKVAGPEEIGTLILAADSSTLGDSLKDVPTGYLSKIESLANNGQLSAEQAAEASLVLAKLADAGITTNYKASPDGSLVLEENANCNKLTRLLTDFQGEKLSSMETSQDAAFLSITASATASLADDMREATAASMADAKTPEAANAIMGQGNRMADNISTSSLNSIGDLTNTSIPRGEGSTKEGLAGFNSVMGGYGDSNGEWHPSQFAGYDAENRDATKKLMGLVEAGAMYETRLGTERPSITDRINEAAVSQGLTSYDRIEKIRDNSPFALMRTLEDPSASAESKATARKLLEGMAEEQRLSQNGLGDYNNALRRVIDELDKKLEESGQAMDAGTYQATVTANMRESYGVTPDEYAMMKTKAEAEASELLKDPAKAREAATGYLLGEVRGVAPEDLGKSALAAAGPSERRITSLKEMQAAERKAAEEYKRGFEEAAVDEYNTRQNYLTTTNEWFKGYGDEIYANEKSQRIAEERAAIEAERGDANTKAEAAHKRILGEDGKALSFDSWKGTLTNYEQNELYREGYQDYKMDFKPKKGQREPLGFNEWKDTSGQKDFQKRAERKYDTYEDDFKAAQDMGVGSWGDRFVHDLPSSKRERFREWEQRVHGGHSVSKYGKRRQEFEKYEREQSYLKSTEELQEEATRAKTRQEYRDALEKEFGFKPVSKPPEAPFSREDEKKIFESRQQHVKNLQEEQKHLQDKQKELLKEQKAVDAQYSTREDTDALDQRKTELRAQRKRLQEEQKRLQEQSKIAEKGIEDYLKKEGKRKKPKRGPNP